MRTRLRRLAEQVSVPEPDAEGFRKLQALADECFDTPSQEAIDARVMKAYSLGWHQGWQDAPCDD